MHWGWGWEWGLGSSLVTRLDKVVQHADGGEVVGRRLGRAELRREECRRAVPARGKQGGSVPSGVRPGARRVRWLRRRGGRGDAAAVLSDGRAGRAGSSAWPYGEGGGGSSGGGWVRDEVHLDRSRESKPHASLGASGAGGTGRGRTEWSPLSNGLQCSCRSIVAFCACTAAASPSACAKKASTC